MLGSLARDRNPILRPGVSVYEVYECKAWLHVVLRPKVLVSCIANLPASRAILIKL